MRKISVTQRCCEWMALSNMISTYSKLSLVGMSQILAEEEVPVLGAAVDNYVDSMPEGIICKSSACVLFSEAEVSVLVKVVDWFDDYMLSMSGPLELIAPVQFLEKDAQIGLVKRNLLENVSSEIKINSDDSAQSYGGCNDPSNAG